MEVHEWLQATSAAEIMTRDVVTLSVGAPLGEAVETLLHEMISGAPVVDAANVCVGVLSVGDIARAEEAQLEARVEAARSDFFTSPLALPMHVHADQFDAILNRLVPISDRLVDEFMTSNLVSVRETDALDVIVRSMVDAHVHRVVVIGVDGTLRGIVSTTDVLAALMRVGALADVADRLIH